MHQPVHSTPRVSEQQQQHARSNALVKLQSQRLQRAEQRLHGKLQGSADATLLHDQFGEASDLAPVPQVQQRVATKKLSVTSVQQLAAQQQHCAAALQPQGQQQRLLHAPCKQHGTTAAVRCITTTAGKGMQSRPPSRSASVRNSVELQQQAQLNACNKLSTRAGRNSGVSATATPDVTHAGTSQPAAEPIAPQQLVPQLQIQGRQLLLQQQQQQHMTQPLWHSKVNPPCAAAHRHHQQQQQQGSGLHTMFARSKHSSTSGVLGVQLGCGVAWGDLAAQAALVAKRSLHYTKQEKEKHRLQLARMAVQQWAWFTCARQQARRAMQHYHRRLLVAGWLGLQQEVSQQQLLTCQASLQAQKHSFMLQSRCFVAWWQQRLRQQRLAAAAAEIQARRNRQTLAGAILGWQQVVEQGRMQRQLLLRSEAYRTLMIMSRALQAWRTWLTEKQLQRLKKSRASQHWQAVVQRRGVACWQQRVADSSAKWHKLANALCFHKHKLQTAALRAWQMAVRQQQEANSQAVVLLQQWQQQCLQQTARMALRCWQQLTQQQVELRHLAEQLVHILQQQKRRHVLQHWHSLTRYHQQLDTAAAQMAAVAGWWWLQHCLDRWRCVVAAMAGRRSAELRELVLLRAGLGTWLKYTEQQRQTKAALAAASATLQQRRLQRMLAAWQAASDALAIKHQQQRLAAQHYEQHAKRRLLLQWRDTAADLLLEREQMAAAEQQYCRCLMARTLQGWRWYCWHRGMKRQVPDFCRSHLLLKVLLAWRDITAAKLLKQQRWRNAVRHHYLATLSKSLSCWQYAMHAAARQQRRLSSAEQHYNRQLQLRASRAWRGPYIQQQRHKRSQLAAAAAHHAKQQQQNALRQWQAHVSAQKVERTAMLKAIRHMRAVLLSKSVAAWAEVCDAAAQQRKQLADAAAHAIAALGVSKQRRVLAGWRRLVLLCQQEQQAEISASAHWRHSLLHKSLTVWRQYTTQRAAKATANQIAQQHCETRVAAAVLTCWQRHVAGTALKRQHMFAAAMHRHSWLTRRSWKAWRLALALAQLERAAPQITQQDAHVQAHSSSTEPQQQQPCLDAVAAAVVAASCASQASWQQQWQKEWQQVSNPLYKQQEQLQQHAAAVLDTCSSAGMQQQQQQQQPVGVLLLKQQEQRLHQGCHSPCGLRLASVAPVVDATTAGATVAGVQVQQSRCRRPPRLPAFMQSEQQQQQQQHVVQPRDVPVAQPSLLAPRGAGLGSQQPPWQPEVGIQPQFTASIHTLQQEQCMPWLAQSRAASPRRHALRQQQLHQQPWHTVCGSRTAGASNACTSAVNAGRWSTPQVRRARLQPRQLQPSVVGCIPPMAEGQPQQQQQQQQQTPPWQGSCRAGCDAAKGTVVGWPRQQQQELHDEDGGGHDVHLLVVHQGAEAAAGEEGLEQPCRTPAGMLAADAAANWDCTAPVGLGSRLTASVLQQTPAPAPAALGYASMLPGRLADELLLEVVPAAGSNSVLQQQRQRSLQLVQSHLQRSHSAAAAAAVDELAAAGASSSDMPYTPMTRQLLQEEVEAMERALQLMTQLKSALQWRQQQAEALQHHIAALRQQSMCDAPSRWMDVVSSTDGVEGAAAALGALQRDGECLQQQDLHQQLQEAQEQLRHVEFELCELKAEQGRQQPRLAGIAERIQQLKAASMGGRQDQQ